VACAPLLIAILRPNGERNVVAVKYDELSEAFDFVSFGVPTEHQAYIDRRTGKIYWVSDAIEDELPEDFDESDQYIAIPHKNDLDLGTSLALRFADESLPDQYRRIEGFFRSRGAYARFKDLLAAQGRLEEWYAFEAKCTEAALRKWCEENDIPIMDGDKSA
jgi:Uncharacterised protein family (UPF0158)